MTKKLTTDSPWIETALPTYSPLDGDLTVDVVVVGGGITGITSAFLLQQQGVKVALLERDRLASGDTARTTAHVTYVTDPRLHELVDKLGKDAARACWDAGRTAITQIADLVESLGIDCEWQITDGFLHAPAQAARDERDLFVRDAALAQELGFNATLEETVPLAGRVGVRFSHQAQFHPRAYLNALVREFTTSGGLIFENSALEQVSEDPFHLAVNGRTIKCDYVVMATHNPLMGEKSAIAATLFQTKLALYTSYAIGARLTAAVPSALLWDTLDPYNYLRVGQVNNQPYAIYGGGDVKTGQEDGGIPAIFAKLESQLRALLPGADIDRRWLGQVIESDDGLPFIGENAPRQFIATAFAGNGMTWGTVAAMMARDRYLGRANPWSDLLRVDRSAFHGGAWQYVSENVDYPMYLIGDRLKRASTRSLESLANGEADILLHRGKKVAAFRDDGGQLNVCSAVCTHMKCLVRWNAADRSWDCPCHGSRFRPSGEVIGGPAEAPLEKVTL